jgi:hypothetical protein
MKKFQKMVENFTCDHCGLWVVGNGFTNHCPACLWSKHVDVNPGDRSSNCGGLMPPVAVLQKNGNFVLVHRCSRCHLQRSNKISEMDNQEILQQL